MNFFYRITRLVLKGYFRVFYRLSILGLENLCQGKAIIAPNHASFLDPPLLAVSCPGEVHFLARASLFKKKILGFILSHLNSHPVRGTAQDIDNAVDAVRKSLWRQGGCIAQCEFGPGANPVNVKQVFESWNKF